MRSVFSNTGSAVVAPRVCPKGVDPAKALQLLKRRLVLKCLHLSRRPTPCGKLRGPGDGQLLTGIAAAPKKTVEAVK